MRSIIVKPGTDYGAVMVVPLDDLFGKSRIAFKLGEKVGYNRLDLTKVVVSIADGMLGQDVTKGTTKVILEQELTVPHPRREWMLFLNDAVYEAARLLASWTPDGAYDLLYYTTTHKCLYVYARLRKELPS